MLLRKKKDRNIGQHGEAAQLTKKYRNRNVKVDLPKTARQNLIETETVLLEDPIHEKKQQVIYNIICSKNEINYNSLFHGKINKIKDYVKMQFSTFLNALVKS